MRDWIKRHCYFRWYAFWVGWYYDKKKRILYIGYFPCCGIKFQII